MSTEEMAETMVKLFHEHCNVWAVASGDPVYPYDTAKEEHYLERYTDALTLAMSGYTVVNVHQTVSDELHRFDLMGIWEEGHLVYLTACVDTSWAEVGRGEYPTGLIDTTVPYERKWQFTSLPE